MPPIAPSPAVAAAPLHPAIPRPGSAEAAMLGGSARVGASEEGVLAHAQYLFERGHPIETIRRAIAEPEWQPSGGYSADQQAHDQAFSISDAPDPNSYHTHAPATVTADAKDFAQFDTLARQAVADLNFPQQAGVNFIRTAMTVTAELNSAADKPALLQKWQDQLVQVFGDRIEEMSATILDALGLAGQNELLTEFQRNGLWRHPALFSALHGRASVLKLWKSSRPK